MNLFFLPTINFGFSPNTEAAKAGMPAWRREVAMKPRLELERWELNLRWVGLPGVLYSYC